MDAYVVAASDDQGLAPSLGHDWALMAMLRTVAGWGNRASTVDRFVDRRIGLAEHEIMVLPRTRRRGHLRLSVLAQQPGCLGVQEYQPVPGPGLRGGFLVQLAVEVEDRPRHGEHAGDGTVAL